MHLWLGFYPQLARGLFNAPCALRQLIQFRKPEEVTGNVGKPRKWMWKSQEMKTYLLHVTGFLSSISWGPLSCSICLYILNPSKLVAFLANQENVSGNPSKGKLIHYILCKSSWDKWNPWYLFCFWHEQSAFQSVGIRAADWQRRHDLFSFGIFKSNHAFDQKDKQYFSFLN